MIFECSQCMVVVNKEVHRVGFRKGVGIKMKHIIFQSFNFSVSDFTHALSKAHEQHAEDLSNLVEDFRTKNVELLRDR